MHHPFQNCCFCDIAFLFTVAQCERTLSVLYCCLILSCIFVAVETSHSRTTHRIDLTSSSSSEVIEEVKQGSGEITVTQRFIPLELDMSGATPAKPARTTQVDHSEQMVLNSRPQRLHVSVQIRQKLSM